MSEPDPELGPLGNLSRAELEPVLWALDPGDPGDLERADNIRVELASRTWQNLNPYAGPLDTARRPGLPSSQ